MKNLLASFILGFGLLLGGTAALAQTPAPVPAESTATAGAASAPPPARQAG